MDIAEYFRLVNTQELRVLLLFGGPFTNALGDTVLATRHYDQLLSLLPKAKLIVWTADRETWKTICGKDVRCTPFISRAQLKSADVIIFDWVRVEQCTERLIADSRALVIVIPNSTGDLRYRFPGEDWRTVKLEPMISHSQRITRAYAALGVMAGRRPPGGIKVTKSESVLFVNPYASSFSKCLQPMFLKPLLKSLPTICRDTPIVVPPVPESAPGWERPQYERLGELVTAAAKTTNLRVLSAMGRAEFISSVRSCSLVIGPDTSTQHIAYRYDIPSISCYPWDSGYRYYYWGCPGPNSLCLRMPNPQDSRANGSCARLVSELAARLLHSHRRFGDSMHGDDPFSLLRVYDALARRTMSLKRGKKVLHAELAKIASTIPEEWTPFVIPELEQIGNEICDRWSEDSGVIDTVGLARLSDVYGMKILSVLLP